MLNVGGQVQPFSGLSLKKVYAKSLRSMYASNEVDGESFAAQSAQGRLSSKSSLRYCFYLNAIPTILLGHRLEMN
ncbi:hypothetical protein HanRHA438_Chr03g0103321 [Helianthus annuus]|nr:hypothetical protein HanRHA438_Chr03g0103321 [Helianthus annuus]